ncbi:hypothetical protein BDW69DRAFT_31697 [Aspergillus filifer]
MAKAYLTEETVYGTTDSARVNGTCYTDGRDLALGCKVFVEGDGCEMTGDQMAAAYDHLRILADCEICGSVEFSDGCRLKVKYVTNCVDPNSRLLDVSPYGVGNTTVLRSQSQSQSRYQGNATDALGVETGAVGGTIMFRSQPS